MKRSQPPAAYQEFVSRFPRLGRAWKLANEEAAAGPLDARTQRLVKLAIAVGAQRESAVHSAARKALAGGVSQEAMEQVIVLGTSTLGFPAVVAAVGWLQEEVAPKRARSPRRRSRR